MFKNLWTSSCLISASILSADPLGESYYPYRSAYASGRGHTAIAMPEPNEEAIFYNPAGLSVGGGLYKKTVLVSPMVELSQDGGTIWQEVALQNADLTKTLRKHEGTPQHLGVDQFTGVLFKKAAIGAYVHSSSYLLLFKDPDYGGLESLSAKSRNDVGLTLTLSHSLWDSGFYVGGTLKYLKRAAFAVFTNITGITDLGESFKENKIAMVGTGIGADLGLLYRVEKGRQSYNIGLMLQDVGDTKFSPQNPTSLPRSERPLKDNRQALNLGIAWTSKTQASELRVLADYRDAFNAYEDPIFKKFSLGGEMNIYRVFGVTGGFNQGYPTLGMYMDIRFLRADIGFYTEELSRIPQGRPDSRLFAKLTVGF